MERYYFRDTYKKAAQNAETNPQNVSVYLETIAENIHLKQTPEALKLAYCALRRIACVCPEHEKIKDLFLLGLSNPDNDTSSKNYAILQMEKVGISLEEPNQNTNVQDTSHHTDVRIGERVDKTPDNVYGFRIVDNLPSDEPSVLFLTGGTTETNKEANGYLSFIDDLLSSRETKAKLYACIYEFNDADNHEDSFDKYLAYKLLMKQHHHKVELPEKINEETQNPHYINTLFNKAFLNRLADGKGKRLPLEQACKKIRQMTIVAHCHGAYTFLKLEEMMQQKMTELGYSKDEQAKIQKELLCIAHAPYAPLGVSKSTMISFVSAKDKTIHHYNSVEYELRKMAKKQELSLCYLPQEKGEVFLTPSMGKKDRIEHMFIGYNLDKEIRSENSFGTEELSFDGKQIVTFSGNAIVNGVKSSIAKTSLPCVKDLVCGQNEHLKEIFDVLKDRGEHIWKQSRLNFLSRNHDTSRS